MAGDAITRMAKRLAEKHPDAPSRTPSPSSTRAATTKSGGSIGCGSTRPRFPTTRV
jgi:hypothetical protein